MKILIDNKKCFGKYYWGNNGFYITIYNHDRPNIIVSKSLNSLFNFWKDGLEL